MYSVMGFTIWKTLAVSLVLLYIFPFTLTALFSFHVDHAALLSAISPAAFVASSYRNHSAQRTLCCPGLKALFAVLFLLADVEMGLNRKGVSLGERKYVG